MIINKTNFFTIADKFLQMVNRQHQAAHYVNIWPEQQVDAVRIVKEDKIYYSICIAGTEICRVNTIPGDGIIYTDSADTIIDKLFKGSQTFIDVAIEREVQSILESVKDPRFTVSLFPCGLRGKVYAVAVGSHQIMQFIDFNQNDNLELVYSSPWCTHYESQLQEVLTDLLKRGFQTNGLVVSIP